MWVDWIIIIRVAKTLWSAWDLEDTSTQTILYLTLDNNDISEYELKINKMKIKKTKLMPIETIHEY